MNKNDIIKCLSQENSQELFLQANKARKQFCKDEVHIRGIIEFSNYCKRDCLYCGLRKSNNKLHRYRLSFNEILNIAQAAVKFNYKTIVLQSGEDDFYKTEQMCELIKKIKEKTKCAITLSIGEKTYQDYKDLKYAGADRYLLRFETSSKELFKKLKPDSSYEYRFKCLKWLKELGYQVGSGNMVSLPGQTTDVLTNDILFMKKLELDMIGIGPFIPHPDTPLYNTKPGTIDLTLKTIAITRIITKNAHMPATTALGSIDPTGRQKALRCGANVIMPNLTPSKYRKYYQIYPGKICINEDSQDCAACIKNIILSMGRKVAVDYGHSLKKTQMIAEKLISDHLCHKK